MRRFKTMGEYVLSQKHRAGPVGEIARDLTRLVAKGNANIIKMQRDELESFVQATFNMPGWNIVSEIYYNEWMDAGGYHARNGYVYLIRAGCKYKIGVSEQLQKRLSSIQSSIPEKIKLVHSFLINGIYGDAYSWERALHNRFSGKNIRGEWFYLTDDDVGWVKQITQQFVDYLDFTSSHASFPDDIEKKIAEYKERVKEVKQMEDKWKGRRVRIKIGDEEDIAKVVRVEFFYDVFIVRYRGKDYGVPYDDCVLD